MHILVTCKNEDDSIKNEWARAVTTFFPHFKSMKIFPYAQGQLTPHSLSDMAQFRTRSRCYGCPFTCKNEEDLIKNEGARVVKRKCGQTS